MRNDIDYKEYSRLRDIAHKRVERMKQAGFTAGIDLPTVKQVRASNNPYFFLSELRKFVNAPTTVKEVRKAAIAGKPTEVYQPKFPTVPDVKQLTEIQKEQRKREQRRRSRVRRAIKEISPEGMQGKRLGYIKAAQTIADQWMQIGLKTGDINYLQQANWIKSMTAGQAKAFVAYTEYRFAQGDFTSRYSITRFVEDFVEMAKSGRNLNSIQLDFNNFLADQKILKDHANDTDSLGMPAGKVMDLWTKFIGK